MKKYILVLLIILAVSSCSAYWNYDSYSGVGEEMHLYIASDASWLTTFRDQRYTGDGSAIIVLGRGYTCWTVVKVGGTGILSTRVVGATTGKIYSTNSVVTSHNPIRGCN